MKKEKLTSRAYNTGEAVYSVSLSMARDEAPRYHITAAECFAGTMKRLAIGKPLRRGRATDREEGVGRREAGEGAGGRGEGKRGEAGGGGGGKRRRRKAGGGGEKHVGLRGRREWR